MRIYFARAKMNFGAQAMTNQRPIFRPAATTTRQSANKYTSDNLDENCLKCEQTKKKKTTTLCKMIHDSFLCCCCWF